MKEASKVRKNAISAAMNVLDAVAPGQKVFSIIAKVFAEKPQQSGERREPDQPLPIVRERRASSSRVHETLHQKAQNRPMATNIDCKSTHTSSR
jgi:hypothetical protein